MLLAGLFFFARRLATAWASCQLVLVLITHHLSRSNQASFQKLADQLPGKILATLDKLYEEFRSLGTSLNAKIETLRASVVLPDHDKCN